MSLSAVAVVGAGPQGLSIAETVSEADLPVTVVSVTGARSAFAKRRLHKTLAMRVDVGELDRDEADTILSRIHFTRELSAVRDCDLVIESAVGDVRMRRAILATLESHVSRGSVLASNISRDELPRMAEVLSRTDQFLGLRFFHPASHTPQVEVMPLPDTAPGAIIACETFVRWLGKAPVEEAEPAAVEPILRPKRAVG
ncbi:MAG TPA: 3-hydroxyacyl-CoA dehydrogenase NAD-binding domain-containing protein [Sandaracinaceae bacterium LLY-WYZ-13_1]|nr:3-hydroxyacyl-CoA dehydrogenase NAD-binding domain-containing protein [Sandaracinaceae bacterium LLY-WYZ-13_1]